MGGMEQASGWAEWEKGESEAPRERLAYSLFDPWSADRRQGGREQVTGSQQKKGVIPRRAFPEQQAVVFISKNTHHLVFETVQVTNK